MKTHILRFFSASLILFTFFPCLADEAPPPFDVKQGEADYLTVEVPGAGGPRSAAFMGKKIFLDPAGEKGKYNVFLGIDMLAPPSEQFLTDEKTGARLARIRILPAEFGHQEFTVEAGQDKTDPATLRRIVRETKQIRDVLAVNSAEKYWNGNFKMPVEGTLKGTFGFQRIINGQPRKPHSGEDIGAPEKTPVYASNDGVAIAVVDHYFVGKGIFLNHGHGIYTEYFHLNTVFIKKGEKVKKGQKIGLVGHTGRATGPHLHWGMAVNGARVNPLSALKLSLP